MLQMRVAQGVLFQNFSVLSAWTSFFYYFILMNFIVETCTSKSMRFNVLQFLFYYILRPFIEKNLRGFLLFYFTDSKVHKDINHSKNHPK